MPVNFANRPRRGQRGNALFVVLVALVVAGALVFSLYWSSRSASIESTLRGDVERAFAAADFGIERVYAALQGVGDDAGGLRAWATADSPQEPVHWLEGEANGMKYRVQVRSAYYTQAAGGEIPEGIETLLGRDAEAGISGLRDVFLVSATAKSLDDSAATPLRASITPTVEAVFQVRGAGLNERYGVNSPLFSADAKGVTLEGDSFYVGGEDRLFSDFLGKPNGPGDSVMPFDGDVRTTFLDHVGNIHDLEHNLFQRGRISLRLFAGGKEHTLFAPQFTDPARRYNNDPQWAGNPGTFPHQKYEDPLAHLRDPVTGQVMFTATGPFAKEEVLTMYIAVEPEGTEYAGLGNYKVYVDEVDRQPLPDGSTLDRLMTRNFVLSPPDEENPQAQRKVLIDPVSSAQDNPTVNEKGYSSYFYKDLTDNWWYQPCPGCLGNGKGDGRCIKCKGSGRVKESVTIDGVTKTLEYPCTECSEWTPCTECHDSRIMNTVCGVCGGTGWEDNCPDCKGLGYNPCNFNAAKAITAANNFDGTGKAVTLAEAHAKMAGGSPPEVWYTTSNNSTLCSYTSNVSFAAVAAATQYMVAGDYSAPDFSKIERNPPEADQWPALAKKGMVACPFCAFGNTLFYFNSATNEVSSTSKSGWTQKYSYGVKGWTFPYFCPKCVGLSGSYYTSNGTMPTVNCPTCQNQPKYLLPCDVCHKCSYCTNNASGRHSTCNTSCAICTKKGWAVPPSTCTVCNGTGFEKCPKPCPYNGYLTNGVCPICDGTGGSKTDVQYDTVTCPICQNTGTVSECDYCHAAGTIQVLRKNCENCHATGSIPKEVCDVCDGLGQIVCRGGCAQGTIDGVVCTNCDPNNVGWMPGQITCPDCQGNGSYVGGACDFCHGTGKNPNTRRCVCNSWEASAGGHRFYRLCPHCNGHAHFVCKTCEGTGKQRRECKNCTEGIVKTNCNVCQPKSGTGVCKTCNGKGGRDEDRIYPRDFRISEDLSEFAYDNGLVKNGENLKTVSMLICFNDLPSRALTETEKGIAPFDYAAVHVAVDLIQDNDLKGFEVDEQGTAQRWWRMNDLQALTGNRTTYSLTVNPQTGYDGMERPRTSRAEDYLQTNFVKNSVAANNEDRIATFAREINGVLTPASFDRDQYTYYPTVPTQEQLAQPGGKDITTRFDEPGAAKATGLDSFYHAGYRDRIGLDAKQYAGEIVGSSTPNVPGVFHDAEGQAIRGEDGQPLVETIRPIFIAGESPNGEINIARHARVDAHYDSIEDLMDAAKSHNGRSPLGEYHGPLHADNRLQTVLIGQPGGNSYARDENGNYILEPVLDANRNSVPFNFETDQRADYVKGPDGMLYRIKDMVRDPDPDHPRAIGDNGMPTFTLNEPMEGAGVLVVNGNLIVGSEFNFAGTLVVMGDLSVDAKKKPDGSLDNSARLMLQGNVVVRGKTSLTAFAKIFWSGDVQKEVEPPDTTQLIPHRIGYNKRDGLPADFNR